MSGEKLCRTLLTYNGLDKLSTAEIGLADIEYAVYIKQYTCLDFAKCRV